jgi:cytochrome c oxidase subunit 2
MNAFRRSAAGVLLVLTVTAMVAPARAAENAVAGRARAYLVGCTSCHGKAGEGSPAKQAPRLAGQDPAYLLRQMQSFRDGRRGSAPGDVHGRQMTLMAATIEDDAVLATLIGELASSTAPPSPVTLVGADPGRGQSLYAACAACHGVAGAGNPALGAPKLAGIDDWYLQRQLLNYRRGLRGYDARDLPGQQMAAQAALLPDDAAVRDVSAYLGTLGAATGASDRDSPGR